MAVLEAVNAASRRVLPVRSMSLWFASGGSQRGYWFPPGHGALLSVLRNSARYESVVPLNQSPL